MTVFQCTKASIQSIQVAILSKRELLDLISDGESTKSLVTKTDINEQFSPLINPQEDLCGWTHTFKILTSLPTGLSKGELGRCIGTASH